uniref:hypothetical protein n=1 Tax=Burkholderia ubonensis TaxID=101571 RepID=UPI00016A59F5
SSRLRAMCASPESGVSEEVGAFMVAIVATGGEIAPGSMGGSGDAACAGLRHVFLVLVVQALDQVRLKHECQRLARLDGDCVGSFCIAQTSLNESYW